VLREKQALEKIIKIMVFVPPLLKLPKKAGIKKQIFFLVVIFLSRLKQSTKIKYEKTIFLVQNWHDFFYCRILSIFYHKVLGKMLFKCVQHHGKRQHEKFKINVKSYTKRK
jgi:hypothetical protein